LFGAFADEFIAMKSPDWRYEKHRAQWKMTLKNHAATLRPMPSDEIGAEHVLRVLQPIWIAKSETASPLRGGIEPSSTPRGPAAIKAWSPFADDHAAVSYMETAD
jgi:hypothetical protein